MGNLVQWGIPSKVPVSYFPSEKCRMDPSLSRARIHSLVLSTTFGPRVLCPAERLFAIAATDRFRTSSDSNPLMANCAALGGHCVCIADWISNPISGAVHFRVIFLQIPPRQRLIML